MFRVRNSKPNVRVRTNSRAVLLTADDGVAQEIPQSCYLGPIIRFFLFQNLIVDKKGAKIVFRVKLRKERS